MSDEWCPHLTKDAHADALALAWEKLLSLDLCRVANRSGGRMDGKGLKVMTFGRDCAIDTENRTMSIEGRDLKPLAQILVLHYLAAENEVRPKGKLISFRQLPGGENYYLAFKGRVIEEIGNLFGPNPQMLLSAMSILGARKMAYGDASVQIDVFPKLPVTVIVWRGDDQVRGSANLLFDETAPSLMSTEDLAGVGSFVLTRLIRARGVVDEEINDRNTV